MSHDKLLCTISKPHDLGYKSLLTHRQICLDFLHSFVHEDWVKDIDDNNLIEVSNQFVTPKIKGKEADLIYNCKPKTGRSTFFY